MVKPQQPETPGQAFTWETVKNKALDFGLCHRCASQLAWGHQNGFSSLRPPCRECTPLIASLPKVRPNGWRSVEGTASRATSWPLSRARDSLAPGVPLVLRAPVKISETHNRSVNPGATGLQQENGKAKS